MKTTTTTILLAALGLPLFLQAGAVASDRVVEYSEGPMPPLVQPYGDVRLRFEAFDAIPLRNGGQARGGENAYFRYRTRLGLLFGPGSPISLNVRFLHEFRSVMRPVHSHSWRWPDELVLDTLCLTVADPSGQAAAVIGRQDLAIPGSMHYLGEGTAKDGSRSGYMNAISGFVRTADDATRLDLFAAYDPDHDPLAIGGMRRDLNGYGPHRTRMDEAGAGAFLRQRLPSLLPTTTNSASVTAFYLWKHDSHWRDPDFNHLPSEDIHTAGLSVAVPLFPALTATAEGAYQFSPSSVADRRAWLAEASLVRSIPGPLPGAYVAFRLLYLSGDDPDTPENEAWNPLWSRYPWYSELLLYGYDADPYPWQNLLAPTLDLRLPGFARRHVIRAMLAYLAAPEKDTDRNSHDRGVLATTRYEFPVCPALTHDALTAHAQFETLFPGDYYPSHDHDPAYFLRLELAWKF
jgi:hypothetical protein